MTDIKVLDRDIPVSVSGSAQKETLRSVIWAKMPGLGGTHVDSLVREAGRHC